MEDKKKIEKRKFRQKKKQEKMSRRKISKFTIAMMIVDLLVVMVLVIIYTPIVHFKTFWIPTAMTTMNHKYLAYTLYSEETVNKVMSENYIEETAEEVNLDDI